MKRTPLRRKSKSEITKVQDDIWDHCKRIIRSIYSPICYTCGMTNLEGRNLHTGHMWAKASLGAFMKYDLRILRPQCFRCNMKLGGMGAAFYARMLKEIGNNEMKQLEKDRQVSVKALDHYKKILAEYEQIP